MLILLNWPFGLWRSWKTLISHCSGFSLKLTLGRNSATHGAVEFWNDPSLKPPSTFSCLQNPKLQSREEGPVPAETYLLLYFWGASMVPVDAIGPTHAKHSWQPFKDVSFCWEWLSPALFCQLLNKRMDPFWACLSLLLFNKAAIIYVRDNGTADYKLELFYFMES